MKKVIFSILLFISIGFLNELEAQALTTTDELSHPSTFELMINDNEVLVFTNENDMQLYLESIRNNNELNTIAADKLVSTQKVYGVFGGYATKYWSKSSGYSIAQGESYKFSGSYSGIKLSFTYKNTVTTNIPANSARYSQLGIYADVTIKKYKRFYPNMHAPTYFYRKTINHSYLKVIYK
ncbi:hypothetical protein [Nosocomiicoccus massiliensis]|nr:hypothetical protein [Nosocomiicoccus massiliensis]